MNTRIALRRVVLVIVVQGLVVMLATVGARFVYRSPAGSGSEPVEAAAARPRADWGETNPSPEAAPKIVVDQSEYDIGIVKSARQCQHVFVIRNEGDAPLLLRRGSTTCKCTMSVLSEEPIPPGGHADVIVATKITPDVMDSLAADSMGIFSHGATIFTNDPNKKAITLRLRGIVRTPLAIDPPQIIFRDLGRGEARSASVVVYSQVWDSFKLDDLEASLPGLTWRIEPADEPLLGKYGASCGYRLAVTTPTDLPGGRFQEWLQMSIIPTDTEYPQQSLKLDVFGDVARSVSISGRQLLGGTTVYLGVVPAGKGARERLTMKVRDEHSIVQIKKIETRPEFLHVEVAPLEPGTEELGLYRIDVEIPPNAPPADFMGVNRGAMRIETDHPYLPVIELDVEFAITGS